MTTIWRQSESGYERLEPSGFPNEAELQTVVSAAPELLPLSGSPDMIVLGSEVSLGPGYVDALALERSGRFALVEVKLARNTEARRAVVAQLLSYASFLRGQSLSAFERGALASHLARRGAASITQLAASEFQDAALDGESFRSALEANLDSGAFRLVWVLDEAPPELVSLVGYLEAVSEGVVIDLVTVAQYELGGQRVIVPQRAEPARSASADEAAGGGSNGGVGKEPVTTPGADDFVASIAVAGEADRPLLTRLAEWAQTLEREGLARLWTTTGVTGRKVLKPCIPNQDVGLVTIWNENGQGSISLWRTVFERCAPKSIAAVERVIGADLGVGRVVPKITDEVLEVLREAYREARP